MYLGQKIIKRLSSRKEANERQDIVISDDKNLLKECDNFDDKNITLNKALNLLDMYWLIVNLDWSLEEVREKRKSKEDHDKYFTGQVRQMKMLSLKYHPDKHSPDDRDRAKCVQQVINSAKKGLDAIHKICIKREDLRYKIFLDISLDVINKKNMEDFITPVVVVKLEVLTRSKYGDLLEKLNVFLSRAEKFTDDFQDTLRGELENKTNYTAQIISLKNAFVKDALEMYIDEGYKQYWISTLEGLKKECKNLKNLERIEPEICELLQEGNIQYGVLKRYYKLLMSDKVITIQQEEYQTLDKWFVQPVAHYTFIISMYYRFLFKLCGRSGYVQYARKSIMERIHATRKSITGGTSREENVVDEEVVERSKRYIKEFLLLELSDACSKLIKYYCDRLDWQDLAQFFYYKMQINVNSISQETTKEILIIVLMEYQNVLKKEFKQRETFYGKHRKLVEEESKKDKKINEELEKKSQELERQTNSQKQKIQQIDLEKKIIQIFWKKVSELDEDLKNIIVNSNDDSIIEKIVQCVEKHGSPPVQVIDSIIEEIKLCRDKVVDNGIGNCRVIELGIEHFLSQGSSGILNSTWVKKVTAKSFGTTSLSIISTDKN